MEVEGVYKKPAKEACPSVASFLKKEEDKSVEVTVCHLAAVDRTSFKLIAKSRELRKGFISQGLNVPQSIQKIHDLVIEYGAKCQEKVKNEILQRISSGERFSISTDELISAGGWRFMCINIHGQDMVQSLGLVKVNGSMPGDTALQLIETKFITCGLDLKTHIVSIISDGAAVMKKCVRLSGVNHRVCQSRRIAEVFQRVFVS